MYRISSGDMDAKSQEISFLDLLAMTRQFEATDSRDRIYDLLGIATTNSDPEAGKLFMEPDYPFETEDIYRTLAQKTVRSDGLLRLLSSVQHGPEIADNLPSWLPQWDKAYTSTLFPFFTNSITPSSHCQQPEYPLVSGDTIRVNGRRVSAVYEVLPRALSDPDEKSCHPLTQANGTNCLISSTPPTAKCDSASH